jgi:hypothetical protein
MCARAKSAYKSMNIERDSPVPPAVGASPRASRFALSFNPICCCITRFPYNAPQQFRIRSGVLQLAIWPIKV